MSWAKVRLIFGREVRDQLRDRRTLFMICVLPLLLYPLLAASFVQVAQFVQEHELRVLVVAPPALADLPSFVVDGGFSPKLFPHRLLRPTIRAALPVIGDDGASNAVRAQQAMADESYDLVVVFPAEFSEQFSQFRAALGLAPGDARPPKIPNIEIYPNLAKDSSRLAHSLVTELIGRWRDQIGQRNLVDNHVVAAAARPFEIATEDVARQGQHEAAQWSKILPLVLVLWALTGAFCPSIDLCAGEKERGTLETLLCCPAERSEIVWGKTLTVMLFSAATAVVNLVSLGLTSAVMLTHFPDMGRPPLGALVWLTLALVPLSALFAALCLALAAFARSTKEGQYYLMPLLFVALPLTILPMAPNVELSPGTALIPLAGMVLVLRSLLEAEYTRALLYGPVALGVTAACCWAALRWSIAQFNNESVLFHEGERWNLRLWFRQLREARGPVPGPSAAIFCGVAILLLRFFVGFLAPTPENLGDVEFLAAATQILVIAAPAVFLALLLTRDLRATFALRRAPLGLCLAAPLLALVIHPWVDLLQSLVLRLYPIDGAFAQDLNRLFASGGHFGWLLLCLAVLPGICEELTYRGFVLSGLLGRMTSAKAIVISSLLFGAAHAILQQSLIACIVGLLIGYLAVQSRSLLPGVLFHVMHNGVGLLLQQSASAPGDRWYFVVWLLRDVANEGVAWRWPVLVCSLLGTALLLSRYNRTAPHVTPGLAPPRLYPAA